MTKKPVILLVDLSNQLYRNCHAQAELSYQGEFTGGLYGTLMSVCGAAVEVGARRLVFCMDHKPYLRSTEFPDYKMGARVKDVDEDLRERVGVSRGQVLALCKRLGLAAWSIPGFEADDLIAQVVFQHRMRYELVVAQSNDSDLGQLFFTDRFRLYRGWDKTAKRGVIHDRASFFADLGNITPEEYVLALSYSGTHNDVPGVHGIGPKKSAAAVRDPAKWAKVLRDHGPLIARNEALIRLPHRQFPRGTPVPTSERVRRNDLLVYLAKYGITPTPQMIEAFSIIGT